MPKSLKVCLPHNSFHFVLIELVSNFLAPIRTSCVLSKLTLRPDIAAKKSNSFKSSFNELSEPSRNMDMSSAYCEILCSEFPILIPLISLLSLILLAKNSAHIMKMYGERGSPWRQPQPTWKKDDK